MSIKSRTIDQLGVGASSRYAKDQALLDKKLVDESRFIPQKTEVSVVKPYPATEFDDYLGPTKTSWASFQPPPEHAGTSLFSFQLVPSLGTYEKQDADTEKLEALEEAIASSMGSSKQEDERERKTVLNLLKTVGQLDRTLEMINARRNQYQRG